MFRITPAKILLGDPDQARRLSPEEIESQLKQVVDEIIQNGDSIDTIFFHSHSSSRCASKDDEESERGEPRPCLTLGSMDHLIRLSREQEIHILELNIFDLSPQHMTALHDLDWSHMLGFTGTFVLALADVAGRSSRLKVFRIYNQCVKGKEDEIRARLPAGCNVWSYNE